MQTEAENSTYVLNLLGYVAVGETYEETLQLIKEAVELHLEDLRETREPTPPSCSSSELIQVVAA